MKIFFEALVICCIIFGCNLERIEPSIGNVTKFISSCGGLGYDYPNDILVNPDGSFIIAGFTESYTTDKNNQAYLFKVSKNGNCDWQKNFGGNGNDAASSVSNTPDGGYIFCGRSSSPNPSNFDLYVVKVDSSGNIEFPAIFHGTPDADEKGFGVCSISSDDFLVGYISFINADNTKIKFLKVNRYGIVGADTTATIVPYSLYINQMIKTTDNNIVIVGGVSDITNNFLYIGKFNEDGKFIWDKMYKPPISSKAYGYGVVELKDKSLIVAGTIQGANKEDFMLVKFSETGTLESQPDTIWGGGNADELRSISSTMDGEIVVMGFTLSYSATNEIYLSKIQKTKNIQVWQKHFDQNTFGNGFVKLCPDGGFIICVAEDNPNADIRLYKTDANGNYE